MCVVSMIMEHGEKFPWERYSRTTSSPSEGDWTWAQIPSAHNGELAKLLSDLLGKAAEYDKKTEQSDCPDAEKKVKLLKLANELGVKIHFPDEVPEESKSSECQPD